MVARCVATSYYTRCKSSLFKETRFTSTNAVSVPICILGWQRATTASSVNMYIPDSKATSAQRWEFVAHYFGPSCSPMFV